MMDQGLVQIDHVKNYESISNLEPYDDKTKRAPRSLEIPYPRKDAPFLANQMSPLVICVLSPFHFNLTTVKSERRHMERKPLVMTEPSVTNISISRGMTHTG